MTNWNWELILGAIGALSWTPWIIDRFSRPKIYGRLISNFVNQGEFSNETTTMNVTFHFLKLSISCINKNFNINDISIKVKYQNNDNWYNGNIYWARNSIWTMPNGSDRKILVLPNDQFLGFENLIEKDVSKFYYLTFLVEKNTLEDFETIEITFNDYNLNFQKISFNTSVIDGKKILWDENLWIDYN